MSMLLHFYYKAFFDYKTKLSLQWNWYKCRTRGLWKNKQVFDLYFLKTSNEGGSIEALKIANITSIFKKKKHSLFN